MLQESVVPQKIIFVFILFLISCSLVDPPSSKRSFSVLFFTEFPAEADDIVENYVMNSENYSDTLFHKTIAALDTIILDYDDLPDIDMDIILTGDAFPEKINNIKKDNTFDQERHDKFYYIREYSVLYAERLAVLDTVRIISKNITDDSIADFKSRIESIGPSIYKTRYSNSIDGFTLFAIMPDANRWSILKQLALSQNVRYIEPIGYILTN